MCMISFVYLIMNLGYRMLLQYSKTQDLGSKIENWVLLEKLRGLKNKYSSKR